VPVVPGRPAGPVGVRPGTCGPAAWRPHHAAAAAAGAVPVLPRVPQAADAAVIKSFNVNPGIVQFYVPDRNAIPGGFWKRKILSGRLADPARPDEVNVSFTLAQRFHLRAGDPLRLVLSSTASRQVPFGSHTGARLGRGVGEGVLSA